MGKFKFTLSVLWFYVSMVFVCLLIENLDFLSVSPMVGLNDEIYFYLAGLTVLTLIIYLASEHRHNKLGVDWILAPILLILLVCNIIATVTNQNAIEFVDPNGHIIEVGFSMMDKTRFIIDSCVGTLAIYVLSFVFSRSKIKSRKLMWVPIIGTIVCVILALTTIFIDGAFYEALKDGYISTSTSGAKGLFANENAFGYFMVIGLVFTFLIIYQKPKWVWMWPIAIFLYLFVIFSTCTTGIILSTFLFIGFTIVQIVFGFVNKRYISTTIGAILFILSIAAICILIFVGNETMWKPMVAVANFIKKEILEKDFETFTGRKEIWDTCLKLVNANTFRAFFGYGFGISNKIFGAYYATVNQYAELRSVHSGYLAVLVSGGWIRFGLYLALLVYYLYCIVRLIIKKQVHFSLSYLLLFATFVAYGFFETSHFFEFNAQGLIITALVLMPPIIAWKNYRHPKHTERIMSVYAIPTQGVPAKSFVSMCTMFILSVAIPLSCSLLVPCMHQNPLALKIAIAVLIFLGATVLFAPYMVYLWYKKATNRRFILRIFINSLWIIGVSIAVCLLLMIKVKMPLESTILLTIAAYGGCLALDTLIYSLFRKGNFVQWIKEMFCSIFVNNIAGIVAASIITLLIYIIVPAYITLNLKTLLLVGLASIEIFWVVYLLIPSRNKDNMLNDFNEEAILELKRLALEDKR